MSILLFLRHVQIIVSVVNHVTMLTVLIMTTDVIVVTLIIPTTVQSLFVQLSDIIVHIIALLTVGLYVHIVAWCLERPTVAGSRAPRHIRGHVPSVIP
jgi:hypothetical protein